MTAAPPRDSGPAAATPFTAYRADGWPLCPQCGEDELYSLINSIPYVMEHGHNPPLQDYLDAGLVCYQCGWSTFKHEYHAWHAAAPGADEVRDDE